MNSSRAYIGSVLLAAAGALFFVLVLPAYDGVSARQSALDERNQVVLDQTAIIDNVIKLEKEVSDRSNDLKQFSYVVPATKSTAELVTMLQTLASQNGLQLTSIAMGSGNNSTEKSPYKVQPIDIALSGGYIAFRSFIDSIEKNIRIIDIDSIDAAPTGENSPVIGFRLKAKAYFIQ